MAAESALVLVSTLARKCAWLSMGLARRQFAIAVPGVMLYAFPCRTVLCIRLYLVTMTFGVTRCIKAH